MIFKLEFLDCGTIWTPQNFISNYWDIFFLMKIGFDLYRFSACLEQWILVSHPPFKAGYKSGKGVKALIHTKICTVRVGLTEIVAS
jgi:hypothetical protein